MLFSHLHIESLVQNLDADVGTQFWAVGDDIQVLVSHNSTAGVFLRHGRIAPGVKESLICVALDGVVHVGQVHRSAAVMEMTACYGFKW